MKKSNCITIYFLRILFLIFFTRFQLQAQSYFIKSLENNSSEDKLFGNQILSDGDYILSGHTSSDILLVRSDSMGNIIWQKTYPGTPDSEEGKECIITKTNNIVVSGYSKSTSGTFDAMLVKVDENGSPLWIKKYGNSSYHNKAWPVDTSYNETLYFAGWTDDQLPNANWTSAFIVKTNSGGDTIWTKRFGSEITGNYTYFRTLAATSDGGCIAVGETKQYGAGGYDIIAIKFDVHGDTVWTRTFGSTNDDYGWDVKQTSDNGFIICGNTQSFGISDEILILKLDENGIINWAKTLGDDSSSGLLDAGRSIIETLDSNYILCGYTGNSSDEDGFIIKINSSNGDTLWTKRYSFGSGKTHFRYINEINLNNYLISGYSDALGNGSNDILFLKANDSGFAGECFESFFSSSFQVNNQNLQASSGIPAYSTGFSVSKISNSGTPTLNENTLCDSSITTEIENESKIQILYYSKPITNELLISMPDEYQLKTIHISNLLGKTEKCISYNSKNDEITLNFSNYTTGIYFVSLLFESGIQKTIKIMNN